MASSSPLVQALARGITTWNAAHPSNLQVDPTAELAVAGQEGLSGGIGDGGHAFGPNQLNNAGGVLTGKFAGQTPGQINQWAWSPAGINYALGGVAHAAGGLTGPAAVRAIVSNFERPADPTGEISRALAAYGLPASGGTVPAGGYAAAPAGGKGLTEPLPAVRGGPAGLSAPALSAIVKYLLAK